MLTERQQERMLLKLERFEKTLDKLLFEKVAPLEMHMFHTKDYLYEIPADDKFVPCKSGDIWQGEGTNCWFKGAFVVPEEYSGRNLYIYPHVGGYEAMLWVNGFPSGIFCSKINIVGRGNHYCNLLKADVTLGEKIDIALEYYANEYVIGTQPFEKDENNTYIFTYEGVDICVKNEMISDFYFDLKVLNEAVQALEVNSFRRADIICGLRKVHDVIYYDYDSVDRESFFNALEKASPILKELLNKKNSQTTPYAGFVGHSHMDTAWLWHRGETLRKCARTYANQISLMNQYPEYTFVQSSAYHSKMVKDKYPALFEKMKQRIAEERYEPNGGVWIECDCNLPSGEFLVRQFLWGQRFTRENYNYTSDCFWLPDTFGYSVSLPQIMKGCGVKYFLTTKMSWNDTNVFPYDSFYWKGLDGTEVLVHLNQIHLWPAPKDMMSRVVDGGANSLKEKTVSNMRLLSYGYGDGGGGPQFEMIEMSRRVADFEGLPKSGHTSVSNFMKRLETTIIDPPVYSGELYLELHRGTLTNQHTIKKNNRQGEIALRNLEYVTVRNAVKEDIVADSSRIRPLMEEMLVNQFHDILPGTSIPRVHDESIKQTTEIIRKATEYTKKILQSGAVCDKSKKTIFNTLSFQREDVLYLEYEEGYQVAGGYKQQVISDLIGSKKLAVAGLSLAAFSAVVINMEAEKEHGNSAFIYDGDTLETPIYKIRFQEKGYLDSLVDKRVNRELRGKGYALNTFLFAEDVPWIYDSWDIDADCEEKFRDIAELISREVVADGTVEFRIRSKYQISPKTSLIQDMIFFADNPEIRFETVIDWQDDHRFLKTAFDTSIFSDFVRQEVQFGHIKRATNRNTSIEMAKFEVSNHKYTDLSDNRYGISLLNNCKYGISTKNSSMWLSLHKGGNRPDFRGDKGLHSCTYSIYPHNSGFDAKHVVRPAYMLNIAPIVIEGSAEEKSLLSLDADNIIVEAVKPMEDNSKGYVLRLYESEGAFAHTKLIFHEDIKEIAITNMLEEVEEILPAGHEAELSFNPFEIKTIRVSY